MLAGLALTLLAGEMIRAEEPSWAMASRLYSDRKARRVGDLLTVQIVEEASATKDAQQSMDKSYSFDGSASVGHPRIDNRPNAWTNFTVPSWGVDAQRSYSGKGSLANKDIVSGSITVKVIEVLPNGNLMIEGKRLLVVQEGTMEMILTGTVRVEDIGKDNVVKSTAVADAAIRYESTGSVASAQKKGLLASLIDWINPF
jgi:flagellar L-ring protein precursor FlgH